MSQTEVELSLRREISALKDALVDLLDGLTARDIRAFTGLPEERCEQLHKLGCELLTERD